MQQLSGMTYILGHADHIGVQCYSGVLVSCDRCSEVRSETLCPSESCAVYIKRDVVGVRALGKSKCRSDTREPRPHDRISVTIYLYIGLMVKLYSHSSTPRIGNL